MPKSILVVDDAGSMRGLIAMTLRSNGYEAVEACDGLDGLDKLTQNKFDMILTDLNMPNMNGIEMIRQIKAQAQYRFIPIVMLTTESEESKKQQGQQAGAKAWIVKPFKPDTLLNVVKKIIG